MKLPVVDIAVSFTEIPDEIALTFTLGNCHNRCPGCHSEYLSTPLPKEMWRDLEILLRKAQIQKGLGVTAVLLMGGTTNGVLLKDLKEAIKRLSEILPVGIYSGAANKSTINKELFKDENLTWLKTGQYLAARGGLDNPQTNQRFFVRRNDAWEDTTKVFQTPMKDQL